MRKRTLFAVALAALCLLVVGAQIPTEIRPHEYALMEMFFQVGGFASTDHVTFHQSFQTHPSVTNCDVTTTYDSTLDEPSIGRCDLMPGTYRMSLSLNGLFDSAGGMLAAAVFNTTENWGHTASQVSKIQVWMTHYETTALADTFMSADSGIVVVTNQSWVEARISAISSPDITNFDGGHWSIERLGDASLMTIEGP